MLQIYVLGVQSSFRGEKLIETIKVSTYPCQIIRVQDPKETITNLSFVSQKLSKIVNNREITTSEFCWSIAHQNALRAFLALDSEWALILEDSAVILENIALIESLTTMRKGPTLLHLGGIEQVQGIRQGRAEQQQTQELIQAAPGASAMLKSVAAVQKGGKVA